MASIPGIVTSALPAWATVPEDSIEVQLLPGASNKVYRVHTSAVVVPRTVIFREFGPHENSVKSREILVFNILSQLGLAPTNYMTSQNYRIEGFYEEYELLPNKEYHQPHFIQLVTKQLKELHSADLSDALCGEGPVCIENPKKWRELAMKKALDSPFQDFLFNEEYWEQYISLLPSTPELVFCHMDMQPLNILYNKTSDSLKLIDFEYSGLAHRAFDIGTFLGELQFDYSAPHWACNESLAPSLATFSAYTEHYGGSQELSLDSKQCYIAANYYWAVWALALYSPGPQSFEYLSFSLKRFELFRTLYEQFTASGGRSGFKRVLI